MKTIDMIQNTEEWHKLRNTRLGASEANIIMGKSKFSTPLQLWEQKIGEPKEGNSEPNFIQAKGHKMEEKIRAALEIDTGYDFPPIVVLSEEYPFLMASLDGYCKELDAVLEAKYVGLDLYNQVKSGQPIEQYYPQIQQQLLLTGAKKCILAVMREDDEKGLSYASVDVLPDIPYIRDELLPALRNFWACVESKEKPDLSKKDLFDQSGDTELSDMITRYKLLETDLDGISGTLDKLKEEIFKKVKHSNVICNGAKIQKISVKGRESWDYAKFLKDEKLVIPETYLKVGKPSTQKKITFQD